MMHRVAQIPDFRSTGMHLFTVASKSFASTVVNVPYVAILVPGIFKGLPDFRKISAPIEKFKLHYFHLCLEL
jgi:hypothetical protein